MSERKTYSIEDYDQIVKGEIALPNFEPMTDEQFLDAIAATGHSMIPKWGWVRAADGRKDWAQFFLTNYSNMGDAVDGGGIVCAYKGYRKERLIGRFAICKHEKGANPSRGWHPGACTKCGLDMTVDSGD
jgi:hypothetical protein